MRVYLPATLPLLAQWYAAGEATAASSAYAVTPELRAGALTDDLDDLEQAARDGAALGSLLLLVATPTAPARRVVVPVEVGDSAVTVVVGRSDGEVTVAGGVPVRQWACVLVDAAESSGVVATAVAARGAGGDGTEDESVDALVDVELGWYGVQELPALLAADVP